MFSLKFSLRVNIQAGCRKTLRALAGGEDRWGPPRGAGIGARGPGEGGMVTSLTSIIPLGFSQAPRPHVL